MPFPDLPERVAEVRQRVAAAVDRGGHGQAVTLIAVTKAYGLDAVLAALDAGIADIGENRVQEALRKMDAISRAAHWHLIGHLQRNKVRALSRFYLMHSLDRPSLADAVDAVACSEGHVFDVLAQVNVAGESTKGGYSLNELPVEADRWRCMSGLRVRGAMAMAPLGADEVTQRAVFAGARRALGVLRAAGHDATELSMGMSGDYEIAVEEGATYVRLGTILFGARAV